MIKKVTIETDDCENLQIIFKNGKDEDNDLKGTRRDYNHEDLIYHIENFLMGFSEPHSELNHTRNENDYNYCLVTFKDRGESDLNGNYYKTMVTIADFDFGTTSEHTNLSFNDSTLTDVPTSRISSVRPLSRKQYEKCVATGIHLVI